MRVSPWSAVLSRRLTSFGVDRLQQPYVLEERVESLSG
jgi:hypothetical protein